jgi:hypothetical protein
MSNYTIAVNWSGKDALSDSDAAKVISGSDFNTEFTTVQTAVNTKADVNGSATESFSATTATAGTNTTQVATTAFVQTELGDYPTSTGTGASGTWAIAISGNAATATSATTATTATTATNVTNALGQGQSWTDVKASRAKGVTYTNSTGKPIAVAISSEGGGTQGRITLTIGSVDVMLDGIDSSYSNNMGSVFGIVPNGTTYSATSDYSTFSLWTELR